MKANLKINFEDGSSKTIELEHAIEIDAPIQESISFNKSKRGKWHMSFVKSLFEGKKFSNITITKNEP